MADATLDIQCPETCGALGSPWDVVCPVSAHALQYRLEGAAALAEADEFMVFTFTQCMATDAEHGVPVDPLDAVVSLRVAPPTLDVVVYSRVATEATASIGRAAAAAAHSRFHVLVQYARSDERLLDFGGTGPVAARAVGTVAYGALLGDPPATLVVRTSRGNTLRLVPTRAPIALRVQFNDEASMRRVLRDGALTAITRHGTDDAPPRVAAFGGAAGRVCMGYGHDDAAVAADAPVQHPERPRGTRYPRERTGAPLRARELADLLRKLVSPNTPDGDRAPLLAWLDIIAESLVTGTLCDDDDAPGDVCAADDRSSAAAPRVPWTAVANSQGGECLRAHTAAAHIRHVRELWLSRGAVSGAFVLCDAIERDPVEPRRTYPVLVAVPKQFLGHGVGGGDDDDDGGGSGGALTPTGVLLFSPGAWRWPTLWTGAQQQYSRGGAEPLGFWTNDVVARVTLVAASMPATGAPLTDAAFRAALAFSFASARRQQVEPPRGDVASIHTHTVCLLGQCVHTPEIIKCA